MLDSSRIDDRTRELLSGFTLVKGIHDSEAVERLYDEGRRAVHQGRFGEAELYLRQSAAGARSLGDWERAIRAELDLAVVLLEAGSPIVSARVLHEIEYAPLTPPQRTLWHVQLGHVLRGFSEYDLADVHFRHAAQSSEDLQDDRFAGFAAVERGALRSVVGSPREAIGYFERGVSILGDTRPLASLIGRTGLAATFIHLGETDRAVDELDQVVAATGGRDDPYLAALVDLHLAEIAILEGDLDLARSLCEQGERAVMRAGLESHRSHLFVLRTILQEESSPESVLDDLGATAERLRTAGHYQESGMLHSLAAIHAEHHGLPPASHLGRSREILRDVGAAEELDAHHRRLYEARGGRRHRLVGYPPGLEVDPGSPERAGVAERLTASGPVLMLARDERLARRLESALPPAREVSILRRWPRFRALVPAADCAVVVEASLAGPVTRRRIAELKRSSPWLPLVVVTEREAENVRHLTELAVDEVVWISRPGAIGGAVQRACSRTLLRWLGRTFGSARAMDPVLREALVHLCASPNAVTSVHELAEAVGRHRASLARIWKREANGIDWRLQDVIAWVVLLRSLGSKSPDRSWSQVANDAGIHVQTLRSYADRLADEGLAQLDSTGRRRVVRRFLDEIVEPLVDSR